MTRFELIPTYTLKVWFDDSSCRVIDFFPILRGEIFGPLRDPELFGRVRLDSECGVLVWPNGADLDPATLHDWPEDGRELATRAAGWCEPSTPAGSVR